MKRKSISHCGSQCDYGFYLGRILHEFASDNLCLQGQFQMISVSSWCISFKRGKNLSHCKLFLCFLFCYRYCNCQSVCEIKLFPSACIASEANLLINTVAGGQSNVHKEMSYDVCPLCLILKLLFWSNVYLTSCVMRSKWWVLTKTQSSDLTECSRKMSKQYFVVMDVTIA